MEEIELQMELLKCKLQLERMQSAKQIEENINSDSSQSLLFNASILV